ncbi:putative ribonuclease, partial [Sphingomonas sp. LH128]
EAVVEAPAAPEPVAEEAPAKPKRTRRKKADVEAEAAPAPAPEPVAEEAAAKPKRTRRKKADVEAEAAPAPVAEPVAEPEAVAEAASADDAAPAPRRGWWQRTFGE